MQFPDAYPWYFSDANLASARHLMQAIEDGFEGSSSERKSGNEDHQRSPPTSKVEQMTSREEFELSEIGSTPQIVRPAAGCAQPLAGAGGHCTSQMRVSLTDPPNARNFADGRAGDVHMFAIERNFHSFSTIGGCWISVFVRRGAHNEDGGGALLLASQLRWC